MTYTVTLAVRGDTEVLRELLQHLIEWSNGTARVVDVRPSQ